MEIGILGCGSLGGVVAGKLWNQYGDNLVVFELNPDIVSAVQDKGLHVTDGTREIVARPRIASGPEDLPSRLDLIILTTKSTTLAAAAEAFLPALVEDGCFMTVQNGLVALDLISRFGEDRVVAGCVMWGASMDGPGRYTVTARGPFVVGGLDGRDSEPARRCREVLLPAFPMEYSVDMRDVLWAKLTVTASLTSLGAITGLNFGELLKRRGVRNLILAIGDEVANVGRAEGVSFRHSEGALNVNLLTGSGFPPRWFRHLLVRAIGLKHRRTESSMLASLNAGAPTEIASVNGIVVALGEKHGIETPVNAAIVDVVRELENATNKPGPECFEHLKDVIAKYE